MESREVIEVLTDKNTTYGTLKCDDMAWRKLKPAIDMAVKALEKQIGQNPYWREEEDAQGYACPCCDMGVVDANGIRDTYCHSCGQRLNWGDAD